MGVTAQDVKGLREKTGAGFIECKRALGECGGDCEKATLWLRERGLAKAQKKHGRAAGEAIIGCYVHDQKIGVLVEVACESDFVARNSVFQELVKELCLQVAAMKPIAVSRDDLPADLVETEKRIYAQQCEGKPPTVIDRIVQGKLDKFFTDACLLDQIYVRDASKTIRQLIDEIIGKLGENIEVRRFVRMQAGEGSSE
jgi:elongation factor Ts